MAGTEAARAGEGRTRIAASGGTGDGNGGFVDDHRGVGLISHLSSDKDGTWACSRCGVRASFAPGVEPTEPIGWACTDGVWRCLGCRRLDVIEAASPASAADSGRRRRRALTEFELLREPSASDQAIAKRAKCTARTVAPVRAALRASGQLGTGA